MAQIQPHDPVWSSLRRSVDDPRPPAPLVLGIAFAALLGWAGLVGTLSVPVGAGVVGIVLIAGLASWWLTTPAALGMAALAWLVTDGFVIGRMGDLSWNGTADAALLVVMVVACLLPPEARREIDAQRGDRAVNKS